MKLELSEEFQSPAIISWSDRTFANRYLDAKYVVVDGADAWRNKNQAYEMVPALVPVRRGVANTVDALVRAVTHVGSFSK